LLQHVAISDSYRFQPASGLTSPTPYTLITPDAFPPLLGTVDPVESASGKMVFRLLAVLAEFERDQISERTKSAMAYKKANGEKVGPTPFGF